MSFFIFVGGIIILILVFNLHGRVQKLEQLIKSGVVQRSPKQNYQTQPQQINSQQTAPATAVSQIPQQSEPIWFDKLFEWLKEDWLLKLGAFLLLIGFGWLTTYAFLNNWIGPMGRIAIGIIAGVMFLLFGWWRIKNYLYQGGIFLALGSTTILLTIFAARMVYDFFTPLSALIVMFLSVAFVAFASVKYNNRPLALLSLILASIVPLLTKTPDTSHVGLFSYLFVVVLGAVWIVSLTEQRILTPVALLIVSFYSLPHLASPSSFPLADNNVLLIFAYAFATIFFITNTVGILKIKNQKITTDLITAAGNGMFLLFWIMTAAQDEWKSLIISAWMVVFAVAAFLIFKITQKREPFYVYAGIGIAMLAAATSIELRGATLIIAYTIESGIISLITYSVLKNVHIAERMSLLLIGPVILSLTSVVSRSWLYSVLNKDFFVLLILGLTLLGLGSFFLSRIKELGEEKFKNHAISLLIIGSIYIYTLLWLSLHTIFQNDNIAVMISLVIFTIIGLITYFYGLENEKKILKQYGGTLVGFVVFRLLLIDVWDMELAGRIITFFLVGALLVSTAFLGQKKQKSNNI